MDTNPPPMPSYAERLRERMTVAKERRSVTPTYPRPILRYDVGTRIRFDMYVGARLTQNIEGDVVAGYEDHIMVKTYRGIHLLRCFPDGHVVEIGR